MNPTCASVAVAFAAVGTDRMPLGLSTPFPLMNAAASARANFSAIRSASQLSRSNEASSSRRCVALGMAASSCSGIAIFSIWGLSVSTLAAISPTQPLPRSVLSIRTS